MSRPGGHGRAAGEQLHQHPVSCPVCGERLAVTGLGCPGCGTELSGAFTSCDYCGLDAADREMLRVFLSSRGNMKELERFLQVSYPTARQRFAELLARLGLTDEASERPSREDVLARLAAGDIDVDEAAALLEPAG
jgi:hypothetical protein